MLIYRTKAISYFTLLTLFAHNLSAPIAMLEYCTHCQGNVLPMEANICPRCNKFMGRGQSQPSKIDSQGEHRISVSTLGGIGTKSVESHSLSPVAANLPSFLGSIGITAGFFMPWVSIFGMGISGTTVGQLGNEGQVAWVLIILSSITLVTHFTGPNKALNFVTGIAPLVFVSYFVSKMGSELLHVLTVGAWLMIISGAVLIIAPVKPISTETK